MGAGRVQFEKFVSALRRVKSSPFFHTVDVRNIVGSFVGFQQDTLADSMAVRMTV